MTIDYNDLRKASTPNGIIGLLSSLGHEPVSDWDGLVDIREIILEDNIPDSIRSSVADDALTIREMSSLVGEEKGIECYCAILRPGLKLSSSVCRNLSHAFRNVSSITRIDETFLFIGVTNENHNGSINGETEIIQWATIHLSRVYRKAGSSEELRLSRLDWKPTKMSRHTLDCLKSLQVDAYPGQVDDTEVERFKKEVKEWFNKERLSRRFFREFYKRFESALDLVQRKALIDNYERFQPTKNKPITNYNKKDRESDSNRQNAGKFMLKQILRLLFLHYLQEKEWLCKDKHFLINQWRHYEKNTRSLPNYDATTATGFHSEVLIPLFFETLNRRRPDDASNNWGETRWDRGDRSKMPYLNGGIFEIDRTHDHFDLESNTAMFLIPDAVFSADRDYDPKLDDETLVGRQVNLLAFLDDYHFTIAEDTPVDEAVALDPELMGKIFENLLVSRHSDGAYYTPRSIVRFQCKDTLARYLEEQLADFDGLDYDWFLTLFDLDRDFSKERTWGDELFTAVVADRIEDALKECKVLDPAVGSGAYLLGMLTEMLRLRQLCHMVKTGNMVDRGSVEFYRWKSEIIRNSLYGVDINPEAVEICHLRLWLAMVVDQKRDSASPLPNLEFQVTAGDSLRDSIDGNRIFVAPGQEGQATLWSYMKSDEEGPNDEPIKARIERIRELRHEYYDENTTPSKRDETRKELQRLRKQMMLEGLEQLEQYRYKQLSKLKKSESSKEKERNYIYTKFKDARRRVNENSFTSIFSYEAIFGDVFQREGRKGFDIVIGNPPYLEDEGAGGYDDIQKLYGTGNQLYAIFWIRSIQDLARTGGQVSFITGDTFLIIRTHLGTRQGVIDNSMIHHIIQCGNWFFTFRNNWTAIMTVTTGSNFDQTSHNLIAYDLTNLPIKDDSAIEQGLGLWKDSAMISDDKGSLIESGEESTWKLKLSGSKSCRIGRYQYPQSIIRKNKNLPFFHASPELFKLIWDSDQYEPKPKAGLHSVGEENKFTSWKDNIDRTIISMNGSNKELVKLKHIAKVVVGPQTGDDKYYLRKKSDAKGTQPIVDESLIINESDTRMILKDETLRYSIIKNGISPELFDGRTYVPYGKPHPMTEGNLLMFGSDDYYWINWSDQSVKEMKNFSRADVKRRTDPSFIGTPVQEKEKAAVIRNPNYYFKYGIHYTRLGEKAPQFWKSSIGIFGNEAPLILSERLDPDILMSFLSSHPFRFLCKAFFGSMTKMQVDALKECTIPLSMVGAPKQVTMIRQMKKNETKIHERLEPWLELSNKIGLEYGLDEKQMEEIYRWLERKFAKPGVIE